MAKDGCLWVVGLTGLTFFGGVDEIGGNKILLEDKGTKVLVDFGQSFSFGAGFFAGWLQLRGINVGDYLQFGLLPSEKLLPLQGSGLSVAWSRKLNLPGAVKPKRI